VSDAGGPFESVAWNGDPLVHQEGVGVMDGFCRVLVDGELGPDVLLSAGSERATVISRATAKTYWPGTNPVGKRIQATSQEVRLGVPWLPIIGVVEDIRQYGFASDARHRAPFVVRLEAQPPADRVRSWGSTPTSRPWPHSLKARCNT